METKPGVVEPVTGQGLKARADFANYTLRLLFEEIARADAELANQDSGRTTEQISDMQAGLDYALNTLQEITNTIS